MTAVPKDISRHGSELIYMEKCGCCFMKCLVLGLVPYNTISYTHLTQTFSLPAMPRNSNSKFYFQQNTTMEQYQEKENTL